MENEAMTEDKKLVNQELRNTVEGRFEIEVPEQGWDGCSRILREAQERANEILGKSRLSNQTRADVEGVWMRAIEEMRELWKGKQAEKSLSPLLEKEITETLKQRGIESVEDWREYVRTMEQDGEVMTEICEVLRTDVRHVKRKIAAILERGEREGESIGAQGRMGQRTVPMDGRRTVEFQAVPSVGQRYDDTWLRSTSLDSTLLAREDRDASVSEKVLTYLRSMACGDPGVFTGAANENFEEFVRRFRRKYEKVIGCEATLMEILGDDHLGGRAKSVFSALPRTTKEQGLDVVIREMARLLSHESTAGRMRALTELRNLRMRPGQEVAEFCIVLENLGRRANPDCTIEERSLEYAQILLDSLSDWPEHFQLVGALHRVDPCKAYEEIKQLALSIEQSKIMFGVCRKSSGVRWKSRATHYRNRDHVGTAEETEFPHDTLEYVREEETAIPRERGWQSEYQTASNIRSKPERQTQHSTPIQHGYEQGGTEDRKCYKCSRYGHIARNCPQPSIRVNHVRKQDNVEKKTLSEIINQARSLGMRVKRECGNADELVGGRFVKELSMLGGRYPALIDTGSMISVVPVDILAKHKDRGVNVDALKLVEKSQLTPVLTHRIRGWSFWERYTLRPSWKEGIWALCRSTLAQVEMTRSYWELMPSVN
ncbi:zinc knuckle [Ostertagia ostertagi]